MPRSRQLARTGICLVKRGMNSSVSREQSEWLWSDTAARMSAGRENRDRRGYRSISERDGLIGSIQLFGASLGTGRAALVKAPFESGDRTARGRFATDE